jgi:hypothetical protein
MQQVLGGGEIAVYFFDVQERNIMTETVETQIIDAEERLRQAMLASNVSVLNELLAPKLSLPVTLENY